MISVFGWPDPNTAFDQSEHALYTCYFVIERTSQCQFALKNFQSTCTWKYFESTSTFLQFQGTH